MAGDATPRFGDTGTGFGCHILRQPQKHPEARNPVFHVCTKHIEVHYHFITERVLDGNIDLAYVGTEDQAADLFTKALAAKKLQRFRGMLGLRDMALSLRGSVEISSSMPT
ncbi:hypothetical protein L7F22_016177 [Adiantum nelumboides]|nr:hypothetical protein [Adiantum nelumboides]